MIDYPRILINRRAALGDVLMATPIIRKLYNDRQGKCFIDFSVNPEYESLMKHNSYINKVITVSYENINLREYDIIINLDLVYEKNPKLHPIDAYAGYVFGTELTNKTTELFTEEPDKEKANEFKETIENEYIVFHLRNVYGTSRNLPLKFWHELLDNLLSRTNESIVFVGSKQDSYFGGHHRLIDTRSQFSLLELKEVIAQAKIFVGTDSGPMHIAATTDVGIVSFFTSVKAQYRRPFRSMDNFVALESGIDCYGCQANFSPPVTAIYCLRNDYECVNRFNPLTAAQKIVTMLKN